LTVVFSAAPAKEPEIASERSFHGQLEVACGAIFK
jgi:hypothetical protein